MIIPVESPHDPRLAPYADLKDRQLARLASDLAPGSLFIAEGELVVRQLLRSRHAIHSVLLTPTRLETVRDALPTLPPETPVYLIDQHAMNETAGFNIHRGILAAGVRAPSPDLDTLLRDATSLTILEDLSNHDNVGGLFRSVAALGGERPAVLLSPGCCDPLYRKAIRVSMGTALLTPFATLEPWPGVLDRVRGAGFTLIALTPATGSLDVNALPPPRRPAFLLGAEGPGLRPETLAKADLKVRIPIAPGVDSLNVVVAGSIAMQRLIAPGASA